jgi:hypothetical protein
VLRHQHLATAEIDRLSEILANLDAAFADLVASFGQFQAAETEIYVMRGTTVSRSSRSGPSCGACVGACYRENRFW